MDFEWDENKSASNLEKHGLDFITATVAFTDPKRIVVEDLRTDYGEPRFIIIGEADGILLFVAYTKRDEVIRIISARRARRKEIEIYEED